MHISVHQDRESYSSKLHFNLFLWFISFILGYRIELTFKAYMFQNMVLNLESGVFPTMHARNRVLDGKVGEERLEVCQGSCEKQQWFNILTTSFIFWDHNIIISHPPHFSLWILPYTRFCSLSNLWNFFINYFYMHTYITKYNLLSLYNITYMYVFNHPLSVIQF